MRNYLPNIFLKRRLWITATNLALGYIAFVFTFITVGGVAFAFQGRYLSMLTLTESLFFWGTMAAAAAGLIATLWLIYRSQKHSSFRLALLSVAPPIVIHTLALGVAYLLFS